MSHSRFLAVLLSAFCISCTSVLVNTTGEEGIQEDPSQRSAGAVLDDQSIQTRIVVNMKSREPALRRASVDAVSHNGIVLLVGQVESEQLKARATEIATETSSRIKRIHNELEVGENRSLVSRGRDTWTATRVRTQMFRDDSVPSERVRVIANNGSIYLMGIVSRAEGDNAARLASEVSGVNRVVKVFEYLD